jgi:DNA primase
MVSKQTSEPHIQIIEKEYEALRRRKAYQEPRITHRFSHSDLASYLKTAQGELALDINFSRDMIGEEKWKEYGNQLLKFYLALTKKGNTFPFTIEPKQSYNSFGYRLSVRNDPDLISAIFYPSSLQFASSPIIVSGRGHDPNLAACETLPYTLEKRPWQDFVTRNDIFLVLAYYRRIGEALYDDIEARGLTVYCAVKKGEGPSVIRRNDKERQRLVVRKPNDLGTLIEEYQAFRFVPDVNPMKSFEFDRIPIDLDRPPTIGWKEYSEFVNGFCEWLRELGFHPRLRLTGGMGAHVIIDMKVNRVAAAYVKPFPRELKFDTWISRVGEAGLIGAQASDLVRILGIAFGIYRKTRLGRSAPITIENHDVSQRYYNIFVDYTRAKKDMGVVSVGSIHHETGGVCLPVMHCPPEPTLQEVVKVSFDPEAKISSHDPRVRSNWIQLVGSNPHLLFEQRKQDSFDSMEEVFEKWGWIPEKYVQLGPDSFMSKYCW